MLGSPEAPSVAIAALGKLGKIQLGELNNRCLNLVFLNGWVQEAGAVLAGIFAPSLPMSISFRRSSSSSMAVSLTGCVLPLTVFLPVTKLLENWTNKNKK